MRIWSLSPEYLDSKGLVASWREGLLAFRVLKGETRGYTNHPQLIRFRKSLDPLSAILCYLHNIYSESLLRGYSFNKDKIAVDYCKMSIDVTHSQVEYEFKHLLNKLYKIDINRFHKLKSLKGIQTNNLFKIVKGAIEPWEITK